MDAEQQKSEDEKARKEEEGLPLNRIELKRYIAEYKDESGKTRRRIINNISNNALEVLAYQLSDNKETPDIIIYELVFIKERKGVI